MKKGTIREIVKQQFNIGEKDIVFNTMGSKRKYDYYDFIWDDKNGGSLKIKLTDSGELFAAIMFFIVYLIKIDGKEFRISEEYVLNKDNHLLLVKEILYFVDKDNTHMKIKEILYTKSPLIVHDNHVSIISLTNRKSIYKPYTIIFSNNDGEKIRGYGIDFSEYLNNFKEKSKNIDHIITITFDEMNTICGKVQDKLNNKIFTFENCQSIKYNDPFVRFEDSNYEEITKMINLSILS